MNRSKALIFGLLTTLGLLILIVVFTWPVVLNPFRIVFGYSGDNFGNIWFFWWQKFARDHHLDPSFTTLYNAPIGVRLDLSLGEPLWQRPFGLIASLTSEIFAFNFLAMLSFFLAFWTMFALGFYLLRNIWAALWAGLLYSFAPYHYWQLLTHVSLSYVQWLPLFLLTLFYFDRKKSFRSAIFLGLSFVLVTLSSFYYGYFSALVAISFLALRVTYHWRGYLKVRPLLSLLLSAAFVLILLFPTLRSVWFSRSGSSGRSLETAFSRQLDELVGLSARPWDFLIYPPNQPWLGAYNQKIYDFIQSKGSDFKVRSAYLPERVVFVGWLNAFLALVALFLVFFKKLKMRSVSFLLLMTFLISMPPYFPIKGTTFYTPSYFLYKVLPLFRVYARMGVYVLLLTTLLSSAAIVSITKKFPGRLGVTVFLAVLVGIALFEFWPKLGAATDLRVLPPSIEWLKDQKDDPIVAEYPSTFDLQSGLIWQTFHQKKIFNMPSDLTRFALWQKVKNLSDPQAFLTLKTEGVKYVVYHLTDLTPNPYDDWRFFRFAPKPTDRQSGEIMAAGFKLVKQFPEALVYEID